MSILNTLNHLYSNILMEFLKDSPLVLYFSSYTRHLSIGLLLNLIQQQAITSMLVIPLMYVSRQKSRLEAANVLTRPRIDVLIPRLGLASVSML